MRNRIIELRSFPAKQIIGAPFNWRIHPEKQQEAVAASLEEIGFYDPLKVFKPPGLAENEVMIIDGHLRQELLSDRIGPETLIPCIVTDLDETEAKKALLTHDPLVAMALRDKTKLDSLLREMETESQDLADMLEKLAKDNDCSWALENKKVDTSPIEDKFNILVECDSEEQQVELLVKFTNEGLRVKSLII